MTETLLPNVSAVTPHHETMTQRVFPRISADWHKKLQIIAQRRGENLSSLTRGLYRELIAKEFPSSQIKSQSEA